MRKIHCSICDSPIGIVDLRASVGTDPILLSAKELASGFKSGLEHLTAVHVDTVNLYRAEQKSLYLLIIVGEYNPLDPESRIPTVLRERRG